MVNCRANKIKNSHRHYELYKYLIDTINKYNINVIWTKGHSKKTMKVKNYEHIFSLVDKDARRTLRSLVENND